MKDYYGRNVNNLRISITQDCHYNCEYCHGEGETNSGEEISLEKIKAIIASSVKMGVQKVKITGGEPLLRKDVVEIVKAIRSFPEIIDISLVTTGLLLPKYALSLKEAGLDRVNIGCDTIVTSASKKTTASIKKALSAVKKAGFSKTKINMVVLKGINVHEIQGMIAFAKEHDVILQLIELINSQQSYYDKYYYPLDDVEQQLTFQASHIVEREMHNRKQFFLDGVVVEVVKPFKKDFCESCTRMRVTSDGQLKSCLMRNDNLVLFSDDSSFLQAIKNRRVYSDRYNEKESNETYSGCDGKNLSTISYD